MSRPRDDLRFVSPESMAEERRSLVETNNAMMYGIVLLIVGFGVAVSVFFWSF